MPVNRKSIDWIESQVNDQRVLDGGPAKCEVLDRHCLGMLTDSAARPDAAIVDAEWVATDRALHYVHFNAGHGHSWSWSEVQGADLARRRLGFAKVLLRLHDDVSLQLSMGSQASKSLLTIVANHASTGTESN